MTARSGAFRRFVRHARYGPAVIVVSGLPRSGTSLMMQMLRAGGVEILTDSLRTPDRSNPLGYEELERVKELDKGADPSWLRQHRGRAVKIISYLLRYLPDTLNYRVLFMRRDLHEVLASQARMLARRGESTAVRDDRMLASFQDHLARTNRLLAARPCFEVLEVSYNEILPDPLLQSRRVDAFLGGALDVEAMAAMVRPELYRNRR